MKKVYKLCHHYTFTTSFPWILKGKIGTLENSVGLFSPYQLQAVLKIF